MYTSTQRGTSGISSGSIDALRVQLMKMNSQQLQAFAQANQDDAIKLSLAAEADKYKKQHAQEAMAMMSGQQPAPPVAQQILQNIGQPPQQPQQPMPPQGQAPMPPQQMAQAPQQTPQGMADGGYVLPEDQGIATLPVGDMDFAEGGIVAFGSGGEVPGYAGGVYVDPSKYVRSWNGGKDWYVDMPDTIQDPSVPYYKQIPNPAASAFTGKRFGSRQEAVSALQNTLSPPTSLPAGTPYTPPGMPGAMTGAGITATSSPAVPSDGTSASPPAPLAPPKPTVEPGLPAIAATKFERTTLPSADVADTLALYDRNMPKPGEVVDPLAKEREAANAPAIQAAGRQVSLFEQEVQNRKPAFEERLKKLDAKEARVNTMEDRNINMALIEAGLAMMSGDSPHAFVNIGKGAQVGMKSYAEGQAKVEAARDKMDEARAHIEEFRRNEDMMTAKERRAVLRDYDNTIAAASKDMFSGVEKMYGIKREDVKSAVATKLAREDAQAQLTSRENLGIAGLRTQENIARAQMQNTREVAKLNLEAYKLPMLYKQVEDAVDKQLATDINYKAADEVTKASMRDAALKKRLLATPGLAQYAGTATGGGGGGADFVYQNGQLVPRTP